MGIIARMSRTVARPDHQQILLAHHRRAHRSDVIQQLAGLRHAIRGLDDSRLEALLRELVPEYERNIADPKVVSIKHKLQG